MDINEDKKLIHPIMKHFLYGQYANLFKFSLWWTTLAPLTMSLLNSTDAIGVGRIVYNTALCLLSPLGGLLVERVHPRKILLYAAATRFLIWCVCLPGVWFFFDTSLMVKSDVATYVLFNTMLFMDGVVVALSSILDIDLCGVDVVANRYELDVTEEHRNQFNSRQEFFFATCFVILSPGMAFLGLGINKAFETAKGTFSPEELESGSLSAIFVATFLFATIVQFFNFRKLPYGSLTADIPPNVPSKESMLTLNSSPDLKLPSPQKDEPQPPNEPPALPSLAEQIRAIPKDLWVSLTLIWAHKPILYRLVFLGFEIAFEDAAIVVVASNMGLQLPWLGDGDAVNGNIWCSVGVASGKLGGALASILMMKYFVPPQNPWKYMYIFVLVTISCVVMFGFPATAEGVRDNVISENVGRALYLALFALYFFFSTLPKLGLMGLFQSMVAQVENGPRIFGFIAIIATSFDALVIMVLSVIFVQWDLVKALWVTAFVFMAHGILELIVGPLCVLRPLAQSAAEAAALAKASESRDAPPAPTAEKESLVPPPKETPRMLSGPEAEDPSKVGTFTQRSAALPIAGSTSSDVAQRVRDTSSYRAAVLSTSHSIMAGSVQRRISRLDDAAVGTGASPRRPYMRTGSTLGVNPSANRPSGYL